LNHLIAIFIGRQHIGHSHVIRNGVSSDFQ